MVILNIFKSTGKSVYLSGLGVFIHADGKVQLTYNKPNGKVGGISYIDKGSHADKFFRKMLKGKI